MPAHEIPPGRPNPPEAGQLHFPDPARLELDQAVENLPATAREVQRTQGRIRALLQAVMLVTDESDPTAVLRRLAASACDLTGAAWAVVVPSGELGRPEEVVDAGLQDVDADRRDRITHGLRPLQDLLADRDTVRLDDAGRRPGVPPVTALLGAAVRARSGRVAHLYLADKHHPGQSPGPFSCEDQELLQVLVSAAGTAVDHAVLLEQTRLREAWQHAHTQVPTAILSDADSGHALQVIAEQALRVAHADTAVITLPDRSPGCLVVRAAAGIGSTALLGRTLHVDAPSLTTRAFTTGLPQITDDIRSDVHAVLTRHPRAMDLGPAVVVPLTDRDTRIGTLSVARATKGRRFGGTEVELLATFAAQAALARRLTADRAEDEQLSLLLDRERIGTDLRDRTIRDLYAIGLDLHGIAGRLDAGRQTAVLDAATRIDGVIKDITSTVFALSIRPEG